MNLNKIKKRLIISSAFLISTISFVLPSLASRYPRFAIFQPLTYAGSYRSCEAQIIVCWETGNSDFANLTSFYEELEGNEELKQMLSQEVPMTILAPNDQAFDREKIPYSEYQQFQNNQGVKYHIIQGAITPPMGVDENDSHDITWEVTTLQGEKITVISDHEGKTKFRDAQGREANAMNLPIATKNSKVVVIEIDKVLLP